MNVSVQHTIIAYTFKACATSPIFIMLHAEVSCWVLLSVYCPQSDTVYVSSLPDINEIIITTHILTLCNRIEHKAWNSMPYVLLATESENVKTDYTLKSKQVLQLALGLRDFISRLYQR